MANSSTYSDFSINKYGGKVYHGDAWLCQKCNKNHSWTQGCKPAPKGAAAPQRADSKPTVKTDCVRADKDKVTSKDRCNLCKKGFKRTDAVIRSRDLKRFSESPLMIHRRCMENLLAESVDDEAKDQEKFERYRKDIADKYGIEEQDG